MYCSFDPAGRSWVKMKKYQRSMRESESRFNYRRSGSTNRNWRQRKVMRAYQDSWNQRCKFLFCCMGSSDRSRNSFTDIARLLSDFFRDLDVVPSDVVAGLVLLRKFQKLEREAIVRQVRTFNDLLSVFTPINLITETPRDFRVPFRRAHQRTNSVLSFKRFQRLRSLPIGHSLHVLCYFCLWLADVPHDPLQDWHLRLVPELEVLPYVLWA